MQNRDRLIDREQDESMGLGLGSRRIKQKTKRIHGDGQHCSNCGGEGGGCRWKRVWEDKW